MKHFYTILMALFVSAFGFGQASIATIDRANGAGPTDTDTVANISATGLTRGSGIAQTNGGDFNSNGWSSNFSDAQANNEYLTWSITAGTGFEIDLAELDIRVDRSGSGPSNWQIFYSLDNFATAGIDITGTQTVGPSGAPFYFNSLAINSAANGTITFRL